MRRSIIGLAVFAVVAIGAYTVLAGSNLCGKRCGHSEQTSASSTCRPSPSATAAATCENPRGKIAGHFDSAMSGMCRFGCATKLEYHPADVMAQPGPQAGKLTQCPVSGVVFAVDANRPHVRIAGDEYVTCCDKCAAKLKKDPRHYLKA